MAVGVSIRIAGQVEHLTRLIKDAIIHSGLAFIDVLQPCVSFNRVNTFGDDLPS